MCLPTRAERLNSIIADLDAKIQALETELQELKYRRNEMIHAVQLPSEILSQIFLIARNATSKEGGESGLGWVRIAHVCSRWRMAALDCPSLWGCLSSSYSPESLDIMISRSKGSPLSIYVDAPSNRTKAARIAQSKLRKILKQTHRLQHISLTSGPFRLRTMLKGLLASAPILETAKITNVVVAVDDDPFDIDPVNGLEHVVYDPTLIVPHGLFAGGAPKLRTLSFIGFIPSFGPSPPHFPSLTHFCIGPSSKGSSEVAIDQLILALSMMPALQSLDIEWPKYAQLSAKPSIPAPIPLPRLNHLGLDVPCHHAADFLTQLHLPGSIDLVLKCRRTIEASLLRLGSALTSSWISLPLRSPQSPFTQLPLDQLDMSHPSGAPMFHMSGSAVESVPGQEKIAASFSVTLEALGGAWSPTLTRLALSPWPTTQVESLSIFQQPPDVTIVREILLVPFSSVYTIDLEHQAVEYFLFYLRSDPALKMGHLSTGSPHQMQTASFRLPNLTQLSLSPSIWITKYSEDRWLDYLASIRHLFERRAALGSPLNLLRILRCKAPPMEEVEKLKRVVAHVEFWPDVPEPAWHGSAAAGNEVIMYAL
ncbi:hypothetical protein CC1G_08859 [Coprinopsis cinerea okayama7|uniref:F-box domain-containing protein n=1 Tax=Coprinopsis cinerea (strain Okayama-7 / 130 / ATCC MYA-4618 / FGSC 9003) TaxID=240176 RepID=A8P6D3_COPC7|nr:hypothetical protein CC1G_08859 [Coprinopsis cinerea okayama7\|eukprot:XP_001839133.1 hypothetical protein CC1G_08859 [Coprinopsis cinerea okayama7\